MSCIRDCTPEDIPRVAELFQRIFRRTRVAPPESLKSYLSDIYFHHPWQDSRLSSLVYVSAGGVVAGFIGVLPLRICWHGQTLRAAVAGSLMVEQHLGNPLAGARLFKQFLGGSQDLSLSDTANRISRVMWERLGGKTVLAGSMQWYRVFRPAAFALACLAGRRNLGSLKLLRPACLLPDRLISMPLRSPFRQEGPPDGWCDVEVDDNYLLEHLPPLVERDPLHPVRDLAALGWMLKQAARKRSHGELHRRAVYAKDGALLGCYLYYSQPGETAQVLQIAARPDAAGAVLDSLFADAFRRGSAAVSGRPHPTFAAALIYRQCVFAHVGQSMVVHSRRADLLAAMESEGVFLNRLQGEWWTRLQSDKFK